MTDKSQLMAQLSEIAYLDGPDASFRYRDLGYHGHKFFDNDGAQCHAVWDDHEYVLCFRGTEPTEFSDIKADLNALPAKSTLDGWVHRGFRNEVDKIWNDILKHHVERIGNRKLYITGHSLGAAMATIAASRLRPECLYTYGSPRVGTRSFVKALNATNLTHYRHVNNNDIVCKVPFALLGYKHHGELKYINHYGYIRKVTFWQRVKDQWRGRKRAWQKGQKFDGMFDHAIPLYVQKTQPITEEEIQEIHMAAKRLDVDSKYNMLDADGDGIITDEEMAKAREIAEFEHKQNLRENEDKKEDQIRQMAWFALWGMLLYPVLILATSIFGVDDAAALIADIAPTYFVAIAGLVAAFFGAQAYSKSKSSSDEDSY